jgi:hypothetical protein
MTGNTIVYDYFLDKLDQKRVGPRKHFEIMKLNI